MNTDALRKLAEELRKETAQTVADKRTKCAQILTAATGLSLLRRKLGGTLA